MLPCCSSCHVLRSDVAYWLYSSLLTATALFSDHPPAASREVVLLQHTSCNMQMHKLNTLSCVLQTNTRARTLPVAVPEPVGPSLLNHQCVTQNSSMRCNQMPRTVQVT
jgi:hypothetical protein